MRRSDPTTAIDLDRPSQARIYDYLLGGSHNFAVDREAAHRLLEQVPEAPLGAQANRAFLGRAVTFLVRSGVRQFLDIGSGIPARGNVHEVAQRLAPESRVAYVDIDPVAVTHARELLVGDERTIAIQEDARRPERILGHSQVRGLLDFSRPVAVLLLSILHFIPDRDHPEAIVAALRDGICAGSYLALSHLTTDGKVAPVPPSPQDDPHGVAAILRGRVEVERYFAGFDLVEPGLVGVRAWRPDNPQYEGDPVRLCLHVGVGRKP